MPDTGKNTLWGTMIKYDQVDVAKKLGVHILQSGCNWALCAEAPSNSMMFKDVQSPTFLLGESILH